MSLGLALKLANAPLFKGVGAFTITLNRAPITLNGQPITLHPVS